MQKFHRQVRTVLARNVREARLQRQWSQEELGHRADISQVYISGIESAGRAVSVDVLAQLAQAFGTEPHHLLDPGFLSA